MKLKGRSKSWHLDSACSRHMTENKKNFLSLTNFQGGNVAFGNGKTGEIIGIRKVGKSVSQAIQNVYYVLGLKHNLLSISQMCDKRDNMLFTSADCTVTNSKN